jgi:hypothetical protein
LDWSRLLLTLRDEMLVMGLAPAADQTARLLLEEFWHVKKRPASSFEFAAVAEPVTAPILLHGHCHQKAFTVGQPDPGCD